MQATSKRRREDASPFEEASPPGNSREELVQNLEASATYRLERALTAVDAQAIEIERLQVELGRLRRLEGQRAARIEDAGSAASIAAEDSRRAADAQVGARKLQAQVEAAQADARAQAQRADEADRRYQQLLREYQVAEEDRLRLASQLKEAVEELQGSAATDPAGGDANGALKRQNAALRDSCEQAERALAEVKRSHDNELATSKSLAEARRVQIEELQQDLETRDASLAAARKETRQTDELEAQLLRARCELREQQRLAENAEVVRSLQSALHAHSGDVAAARRLKQKTDNAEALNEEIATLRTKLARAEKAAESAMRNQGGVGSDIISPEAVQSRIHALHAENVRLASEQTTLASRQGTAAATEKQLQAEVMTLRKQAMQLKREHSKAEQKATQLQRDIEFERYQKKGLQQLVDSFASTPADAAAADEDEEEESGIGGAKKSGATTAVAAGQEKAKQDAAALAEAQASLKKCESRIAELEERRAELEAANATLSEQAAKCADAETEAAAQLARAETATKATTAAEALLSSVRDELTQVKLAADEWKAEKASLASYRATAETERAKAAEEKRELLAQNARLIEEAAANAAAAAAASTAT